MTKQFGLIYLAALLIIVLAFLFMGHPDDAVKTLLIGAVTALLSKIQTVFDFFYGSSQGSKDKDVIINQPKTGA